MKKVFALLISVVMLFSLVACAGDNKGGTDADDVQSIIASYSVKNENSKGKFIVEVQNLGGVYEDIYDVNGVVIKFRSGEDEIYDTNGKKIERTDLKYGDTLEIQYDGTVAKSNPKTIKAYKVIKY